LGTGLALLVTSCHEVQSLGSNSTRSVRSVPTTTTNSFTISLAWDGGRWSGPVRLEKPEEVAEDEQQEEGEREYDTHRQRLYHSGLVHVTVILGEIIHALAKRKDDESEDENNGNLVDEIHGLPLRFGCDGILRDTSQL